MDNEFEVDPFHLRELSEDIERRTFQILVNDFPSIVSLDALNKVRLDLLNEINTLIAELMNDVLALQQHLGIEDIINRESRIYSLPELAELLPTLCRITPEPDGVAASSEDLKQQCITQVKWVVHVWMQVFANLAQRLSDKNPMAVQVEVRSGDEDKLVSVPLPMEIDIAVSTWQMVRRLVMEYLQKKADLLRAYGDNLRPIMINYTHDNDLAWNEARSAFWNNTSTAAVVLLQGMRDAFLQALDLRGPEYPVDLRMLPTDQLPFLAQRVGVIQPFDPKVLHTIALNLEWWQAYCTIAPVSLLYTYYRIVGETVEKLQVQPPSQEMRRKVNEILAQCMRNAQNA
jgi:hypothetical protein